MCLWVPEGFLEYEIETRRASTGDGRYGAAIASERCEKRRSEGLDQSSSASNSESRSP